MFNIVLDDYIYGIGLLNGLLTLITILLLLRTAFKPKASLIQVHKIRDARAG